MKEIDRENFEQIKKIISEHAWPKVSDLGDEASVAMWLLVQYVNDLEFQKNV